MCDPPKLLPRRGQGRRCPSLNASRLSTSLRRFGVIGIPPAPPLLRIFHKSCAWRPHLNGTECTQDIQTPPHALTPYPLRSHVTACGSLSLFELPESHVRTAFSHLDRIHIMQHCPMLIVLRQLLQKSPALHVSAPHVPLTLPFPYTNVCGHAKPRFEE